MTANLVSQPNEKELTVDDYAARINGRWTKAKEDILAVAKLCSQAKTSLDKDGRAQLIKQLQFSASAFSKLATIGENDELHSEKVIDLLPSNYSIMYEAALLPAGRLKEAIDGKILHPRVKRSKLMEFRKSEPVEFWKKEGKPREPRPSPFANIFLPSGFTDEQREKLNVAIAELGSKFPTVRFDVLLDPYTAAMGKWHRQVETSMAREAKKRVKAFLLREHGKKPKSVSWRQWIKSIGFAWEEVELTVGSNFEEIEFVYRSLGIEYELAALRDNAINACDSPNVAEAESDTASAEQRFEEFLEQRAKRDPAWAEKRERLRALGNQMS